MFGVVSCLFKQDLVPKPWLRRFGDEEGDDADDEDEQLQE